MTSILFLFQFAMKSPCIVDETLTYLITNNLVTEYTITINLLYYARNVDLVKK